ncbi:MAG: hypothetical protein KatS3mg031_0184 [Chitinophagales bacterium]|nr:MAG: hypothetical protein KatS3mg031_0184 [Chitinophagales bacterium]
MINLFLDAEWFPNQRIFLIGYGYENTATGSISIHQCFYLNIELSDVLHIFRPVNGLVFVYGPDLGMLEKRFPFPFRQHFHCINFLRLLRKLEPRLPDYRLATVEKHFGIKRQVNKYKKNMMQIYRDWFHPQLRQHVLWYNYEDVRHFIMLKLIVFARHDPSSELLHTLRMKPRRQMKASP